MSAHASSGWSVMLRSDDEVDEAEAEGGQREPQARRVLVGLARNRRLSVFTATRATGLSLGLVLGGALTETGRRCVFFLLAPVALVTLVAGLAARAEGPSRARCGA